jgi:hypothetical protein
MYVCATHAAVACCLVHPAGSCNLHAHNMSQHNLLHTCTHAQAICTTTSVLEAAIAQAIPAGLSTEVADSLARQRCEQTPLLSAVTWALRQVRRT